MSRDSSRLEGRCDRYGLMWSEVFSTEILEFLQLLGGGRDKWKLTDITKPFSSPIKFKLQTVNFARASQVEFVDGDLIGSEYHNEINANFTSRSKTRLKKYRGEFMAEKKQNEDDTEKWKQVLHPFSKSQLSSIPFFTTNHRKKALNFLLSVNNSLGHCLSISHIMQQRICVISFIPFTARRLH